MARDGVRMEDSGNNTARYGPGLLRAIQRDLELSRCPRPNRSDAGTGAHEARGDASLNLSNDARNTILEHLKEALTWCADNRDWDAVLFIVTLMRKTHDEP